MFFASLFHPAYRHLTWSALTPTLIQAAAATAALATANAALDAEAAISRKFSSALETSDEQHEKTLAAKTLALNACKVNEAKSEDSTKPSKRMPASCGQQATHQAPPEVFAR